MTRQSTVKIAAQTNTPETRDTFYLLTHKFVNILESSLFFLHAIGLRLRFRFFLSLLTFAVECFFIPFPFIDVYTFWAALSSSIPY